MSKRPTRDQLNNYSLSELKTFLRKRGHIVPRNFPSAGYITRRGSKMYRWRWWSDGGFVVDVSESISNFDRWANSTESTKKFNDLFLM